MTTQTIIIPGKRAAREAMDDILKGDLMYLWGNGFNIVGVTLRKKEQAPWMPGVPPSTPEWETLVTLEPAE